MSRRSSLAPSPQPSATAPAEPLPEILAAALVDTAIVAKTKLWSVVRATPRFDIDLRRLTPEPAGPRQKGQKREQSAEEKAVRTALSDVAKRVVTAANALVRELDRRDGGALDAFVLEHGRTPLWDPEVAKDQQEWQPPLLGASDPDWLVNDGGGPLNAYQLVRRHAPTLCGGIASAIARAVTKKWFNERWEIYVRQTRRVPSFKKGDPIPVRAQEISFSQDAHGHCYASMLLYERGVACARFRLPIDVRDERQKRLFGAFLAQSTGKVKPASNVGSIKFGAALIEQDRLRPWRWYLRVSYTQFVVPRTQGLVAAVTLGIRCFICSVLENGKIWIDDGRDIEAYLRQIQRRRKEYQYGTKASNRVGHGLKRTIRPIEKLTGKAERWRKTTNQTKARRLAMWLRDRGVSKVRMASFAGVRDTPPELLEGGERVWRRVQEWPYHDLGTRLVACLEEYGIEVEGDLVPERLAKCPVCGLIDQANIDRQAWKFVCQGCTYKKHLEVAQCEGLLKSPGVSDPMQEDDGSGGAKPPPSSARKKKKGKPKRSPVSI